MARRGHAAVRGPELARLEATVAGGAAGSSRATASRRARDRRSAPARACGSRFGRGRAPQRSITCRYAFSPSPLDAAKSANVRSRMQPSPASPYTRRTLRTPCGVQCTGSASSPNSAARCVNDQRCTRSRASGQPPVSTTGSWRRRSSETRSSAWWRRGTLPEASHGAGAMGVSERRVKSSSGVLEVGNLRLRGGMPKPPPARFIVRMCGRVCGRGCAAACARVRWRQCGAARSQRGDLHFARAPRRECDAVNGPTIGGVCRVLPSG